jgi:hypothetical protein
MCKGAGTGGGEGVDGSASSRCLRGARNDGVPLIAKCLMLRVTPAAELNTMAHLRYFLRLVFTYWQTVT